MKTNFEKTNEQQYETKLSIIKNLWNNFYNSRIGQYLIYEIIYIILWQLAGFEFTVIICLTAIFGEIQYQQINRK